MLIRGCLARQTRGEHFEGVGGPGDKLARQERDYGGYDSLDATDQRRPEVGSAGMGGEGSMTDPLREGRDAVRSNVAGTRHDPKKDHVKGSDYYVPESVPGSISAEGNEPPESVVQASREAER